MLNRTLHITIIYDCVNLFMIPIGYSFTSFFVRFLRFAFCTIWSVVMIHFKLPFNRFGIFSSKSVSTVYTWGDASKEITPYVHRSRHIGGCSCYWFDSESSAGRLHCILLIFRRDYHVVRYRRQSVEIDCL